MAEHLSIVYSDRPIPSEADKRLVCKEMPHRDEPLLPRHVRDFGAEPDREWSRVFRPTAQIELGRASDSITKGDPPGSEQPTIEPDVCDYRLGLQNVLRPVALTQPQLMMSRMHYLPCRFCLGQCVIVDFHHALTRIVRRSDGRVDVGNSECEHQSCVGSRRCTNGVKKRRLGEVGMSRGKMYAPQKLLTMDESIATGNTIKERLDEMLQYD